MDVLPVAAIREYDRGLHIYRIAFYAIKIKEDEL